jgi:glycosyltransferase involved in cell wall biosynthesis
MSKPAIAIVIPGGIGTGRANIGVPVLEQITKLLVNDFSISVFQLYKTNADYRPEGFELIEIFSSNPAVRILKFLVVFRRIHREKKFHAVHGFWGLPAGFLAVLTGKIFKIKSLVSLQGGDAIALPQINYGQLEHWLPRKFALWTMRHADVLISPAQYCIDNLAQYELRRDDIHLIPLGIDTTLFQFNPRSIEFPVKFIHVGNFNRVKDQRTLLRAFRLISREIESELTIIGEGELEKEIRSLVTEYELTKRVVFMKPLSNVSLVECYHQSHVMLHSSLSEGHPIVAEEAMSCGVLVCGTKVGLLYDLERCCVSVKTGDHESLAAATLQILRDHNRIEALRYAARQWTEAHSIFWTVKKFGELYRK